PSSADVAAGFTYAFDCGEGAGYGPYSATSTRSCPTSDNGTRATEASIKDKDGGTAEYAASVTVTNVAPTIDALPDAVAMVGSDVTISASFSDPGTGDGPWSSHVDWGDGSVDDGSATTQPGPITATHRYALGGVYA